MAFVLYDMTMLITMSCFFHALVTVAGNLCDLVAEVVLVAAIWRYCAPTAIESFRPETPFKSRLSLVLFRDGQQTPFSVNSH